MGSGRPKSSLNLTAQERADLEAIVASRSLPHGLLSLALMPYRFTEAIQLAARTR
jgi:hypothetical protein